MYSYKSIKNTSYSEIAKCLNLAFDAGTGVIPEHMGKKVFTNIFQFVEQELKKHQIKKYYLEVLQQNEKAISSYEKQGVTISRAFSVFKASDYYKEVLNKKVKYLDFKDFDLNINKLRYCN